MTTVETRTPPAPEAVPTAPEAVPSTPPTPSTPTPPPGRRPAASSDANGKSAPQTKTLPLDMQQRAAAAEEIGPVLVLGGPGVGKTHVLLARIERLMESGVRPQTITYVTFGARIADQTRRQLEEVTNETNIFVGTLHHYASFFLRSAGAAVIGISPYFSIWDKEQAAEAIAEIARGAEDSDLKMGSDEIESFLHWKGFNQSKTDNNPKPPPSAAWHTMLELYAREKYRQQTLDLDDIIPHAVYAMEQKPKLRQTWAAVRSRHLLVDEFQDITQQQYKLISLMVGPERSLTVASDPNQSIYTWRGAEPRLLHQFNLDFPNAKTHMLTLNHRSTRTLTDLSSQLTRHQEVHGLIDSGLQSIRPEAGRPQILYFDGSNRQMDAVLTAELQHRHEVDGTPWHDMALIFRHRSTANRLRAQLTQASIPHTLISETLSPQEDDVQNILGLLTCLVNPMDTQAFALAAGIDDRRQRRRLSEVHCQQVLNYAQRNDTNLVVAADHYKTTQSRSSGVYKDLDHVVKAWSNLTERMKDPAATVPGLCRAAYNLLHRSRRPGELPPPPDPATARLYISADASQRLPDEDVTKHLSRFLETVRAALYPEHRTVENSDPLDQEKGVALSTIHAAKGLQWPCVWVVDAADHIMPGYIDPERNNRQSRLEEEQRLFYVAATRATDHLAFCCAGTNYKGEPAYPSRYLEPIEDTADYRRIPAHTADGDQ